MISKIRGLIAAPFTPFAEDGSLKLEMIPAQAEFLKGQDVAGVFVGGTTGEGGALTLEERKDLAEAWIAQAGDTFRIIVHAGHSSSREGAGLARHAQKIGAAAVGAIYSNQQCPSSVHELVAYCAEIAAGAPELPFYYYHMPAQTRVPFKAAEILRAASRVIPNLAGCKFTFEDLMDYQQCLDLEDGRFDILFGRDEMILASLAVGAEGWIGSTYNYAGLLHRRLINAFQSGDLAEARRCQKEVQDIIQVMVEAGGLPAGKAISSFHGLDLGPVRPPLKPLGMSEIARLGERLKSFALGPVREDDILPA